MALQRPLPTGESLETSPVPDNVSYFRVVEDRQRHYRRFDTLAREVTVVVEAPPTDHHPDVWLRQVFEGITAIFLTDEVAPQDKIGFTFFSASHVSQRPIGLSMCRRDQFSMDVLLQLLERRVQNNDQFLVAGALRVAFIHVAVPLRGGGGGGGNNPVNRTSDFTTPCKRQRGIITITNDDNLCLARALVVGMAFSNKDDSPQEKRHYEHVRKHCPSRRQNRQTIEAERLCNQAGVDLSQNGGGIEEIKRFQGFLTEYTITVFTERDGNKTMFKGPSGTPNRPRKNINLIFENNHYNVITSKDK